MRATNGEGLFGITKGVEYETTDFYYFFTFTFSSAGGSSTPQSSSSSSYFFLSLQSKLIEGYFFSGQQFSFNDGHDRD